MYLSGLGATKEMVFRAIIHLRELENPLKKAPSRRWIQTFLKGHPDLLRTTKTKPIAITRISAQDVDEIQNWFTNWAAFCKEHNIQASDILNFDETGLRIRVTSGEEVIIPAYVSEAIYIASPENQKSLSIIKTISANGTTFPPVVIVQGKNHMTSWYKNLLVPGMRVLLSEIGYTNSELSLQYLDHLNQHLDLKRTRPKILLMEVI